MTHDLKPIPTGGLTNLAELPGSDGWYWSCDYASGDLYEAQELFASGHPIKRNRLLFLHYPEGRVVEPMKAEEGQYFGAPAFWAGQLHLLLVDFPAAAIRIFRYDDDAGQTALEAQVPLGAVQDCYNLMLHASPLMLTRQGSENLFQILWPEQGAFSIGHRESFCSREGDRLYFTRWFEDPDYRDEVVIRRFPDGAILETFPGTLWEMPDGQRWVLQ